MRALIRKPLSARHSRKKRLLTLLTSRLFIIVVLILLQLFLLLFTLVELFPGNTGLALPSIF